MAFFFFSFFYFFMAWRVGTAKGRSQRQVQGMSPCAHVSDFLLCFLGTGHLALCLPPPRDPQSSTFSVGQRDPTWRKALFIGGSPAAVASFLPFRVWPFACCFVPSRGDVFFSI